jgi:hypothetical protein
MIDFTNERILKLNQVDPGEGRSAVEALLLDDESVAQAFKGGRDMVVFTSRRIITVNVQGLTGKKTDYSSLPYSKIQAFSVETAGSFDRDTELELWFSGLGKVRLEFGAGVDIRGLGRWLAHFCI